MFDASQYAFFGNDEVEEVELGGLEEEDEILSFNGIGDGFSFDKEEVIFHSISLKLATRGALCFGIDGAFLWFLYTLVTSKFYSPIYAGWGF